jgi:hypothetical protein
MVEAVRDSLELGMFDEEALDGSYALRESQESGEGVSDALDCVRPVSLAPGEVVLRSPSGFLGLKNQ